MPCGVRMVMQTSRCDDMRTTKHWVRNGNPVLPVCSWTVFHLGAVLQNPWDVAAQGSLAEPARLRLRGSCFPLTQCDGGEGWVSLAV